MQQFTISTRTMVMGWIATALMGIAASLFIVLSL
jgi:hypothetical protein